MSVEAISWALKQQVGLPNGKVILFCLANYADDEGQCWPSQVRLARQCEVSIDTVQRRLKDMEDKGLLRREPRYREDGARRSDMIVLRMPSEPVEIEPKPHAAATPPQPAAGGLTPHGAGGPTAMVRPYNEPSLDTSLSSSFFLDSVLEQKPIKKVVPRDKPERELLDEFNQRFWPEYPRRVAKQAALKAWLKVRRETPLEDILAGLEVYVAHKPEAPFVKHPATWLNGGCWNDDPAAISPKIKPNGKPDPTVYVPPPPEPDADASMRRVADEMFVDGFLNLHGEELQRRKQEWIAEKRGRMQ